jgi:YVTN family beta-propeller protein
LTGRGRLSTARFLLLATAATAGLAGLASAAGLFSSSVGERPSGAGVAEISAVTNRLLREIQIEAPNDVETGFGSTWVTETRADSAAVARVDPDLRGRPTPTDLAPATATSPDDLAVGGGAIWATVADGLYRIDPARPEGPRRIRGLGTGGLLTGVAVGAGRLWVVDSTGSTLTEVDPQSGHVSGMIPLPGSGDGVATGEGAVWVPSVQGESVFKVSPSVGRVIRAIPVEDVGNGIAAGAGSVWVTAQRRDALARIDPVSSQVTWIPAGDAPTDVAVGGGAVWVANSGAGTVSRLDASTGELVTTISVPRRPNRVAVGQGSVWVTFLGEPDPPA